MNQCVRVGLDALPNSITATVLDGDVQAPQVTSRSGDLKQIRRLIRRLADTRRLIQIPGEMVWLPSLFKSWNFQGGV